MSVWRVTPIFSDASLRVIPLMSLAVKSACIVSIYRLNRQGERHRGREACFLGRCRAGIVPLGSPARGSAVRWRAAQDNLQQVTVVQEGEGRSSEEAEHNLLWKGGVVVCACPKSSGEAYSGR